MPYNTQLKRKEYQKYLKKIFLDNNHFWITSKIHWALERNQTDETVSLIPFQSIAPFPI